MLVLGRKLKERVRIAVPPSSKHAEIWVELYQLRPGKARLGFDAPGEIAIHREEVWNALQRGDLDDGSQHDHEEDD